MAQRSSLFGSGVVPNSSWSLAVAAFDVDARLHKVASVWVSEHQLAILPTILYDHVCYGPGP
eukprot:9085773-Lingulodinium_polyedra.AAC.1